MSEQTLTEISFKENVTEALQTIHDTFKGDVEAIESVVLKEEQADCPVIHRFGPGTYIREVHLPAGIYAIGHHQNFEHMNIMLTGKVTVIDDHGNTNTLTAPAMFVGKPGRKVGYIHEDVVWLNIYATTETDVEKLEAMYLTKSNVWNEDFTERLQLLEYSKTNDDYQNVLKELGVTEEEVRQRSEVIEDMVELPFGSYKIKIGNSNIEGKGLKATANIVAGEYIAPARIGLKRTIAGRYTNHSASPNAEFKETPSGDVFLVALKDIQGCKGGQDGEEITIDYRQAYRLARKLDELVLHTHLEGE